MAFTITNLLDEKSHYFDRFEYIVYKDNFVINKFLKKFDNDKLFYEDDFYILVLDGVLLNKIELFKDYESKDILELVKKLYLIKGKEFFNLFRGSFSGALYNKKTEKWVIYTNHYGDNMLFYYFYKGKYVVSSSVIDIVDILRLNSIHISLNEKAFVSMLTYGYMSDDFTYAEEIQRLTPGNYMEIGEDDYSIYTYYRLKNNVYDLKDKSESEIIDDLDVLFKKAITLEYRKDMEYGYNHLSELSGGLDSRMSLWIAKELGFNNITLITFAESGSLDEKIAKNIARDLGLHIFHLPLDSAKHILEIDEYTRINYGLSLYGGIGGEKVIMDTFCMDKFGLMHTGQIGDVVIGSFINSLNQIEDYSLSGLYSERLINKSRQDEDYIYTLLGVSNYKNKYNNREDYLMYVRAFMGCLTSHLFTRKYTEVSSPFLNLELLEYCMSIPIELRINHKIYKKWIIKKHPNAAKYIWERIGKRIDEKESNVLLNKMIRALKNPRLVLKKLGYHIEINEKHRTGMNPMDLWWERNQVLRETYDNYYKNNIEKIKLNPWMFEAVKYLYSQGNTLEKMMALTAISSIKLYFDEESD